MPRPLCSPATTPEPSSPPPAPPRDTLITVRNASLQARATLCTIGLDRLLDHHDHTL
ncbi:hypothetical protein [Streptomyces longisporoflavus]|uniref:hypothetical protein n=1 Tax=Streptomyces longisporoflavus TaxID=28044 RepID=UPI001E363CFC|nr:hypothetical protein [Streptomyces longisporoflavus]